MLRWLALAAGIVVFDQITKYVVEHNFVLHEVREVTSFFNLVLVYNRGAAFSMHVGDASRWFFSVVAVIVLIFLGRIYRAAHPTDVPRGLALGLVCGGAIGNLIDRLRSALGVIDFIDIGIGEQLRWYTFNVADMGVSVGAVLLAWSLWREERKAGARG